MIDATPLLRLYAEIRLARLAQQDAVAEQERVLDRLLACAKNTRFGLAHRFHQLKGVDDYQRAVRLRSYDDFWNEYWHDDFPVLAGSTWPERIPYFAITSGTASGTEKHIPVSRMMLRAHGRAALDVLTHHLAHFPGSRVLGGKTFMLGGSTDLVPLVPGVLQGDLSDIVAREVPRWLAPYSFPPRAEALDSDWEHKVDRLAHLAAGKDIRLLAGTPNWMLAFLDHMTQVTGRGPALAHLFPHLEAIIHGGIGFRPYAEHFTALLTGSMAETREVYPASEGFIAIADRGPGEGMRLLADNGLFFEFVPVAELKANSPPRHWLGNVEPGIDYALVLSNCAGLFSYILGDVVRLVSLKPPRLLVIDRISTMLNVVGEHLSGEQLEDAVLAAASKTQIYVSEYTVGVRHSTGSGKIPAEGGRTRHVFVVEFTRLPHAEALAAFARRLDACLQVDSVDYRECRLGDILLPPPDIIAVPPGTFIAWMKRRGRNKVPRVITDETMLETLVSQPDWTKPPED
jgi:hypothetical protein